MSGKAKATRNRTTMRRPGEGSINFHKASGKWEAALAVGCYPNGNPKRKRVLKETEPEAITALAEMIIARDRGLLTEPNHITVAAWLDKWLEGRHHLGSRTRLNYGYSIGYVTASIGRVKLQQITPAHVRQAVDHMARAGLAISSQRKSLSILKAALEEALELEILARNPAAAVKIRAPRVQNKVATAWEPAEVEAFLTAAAPSPQYAVFYLMLSLGLRRSEALGLAWKHVDLAKGVVRIRQAYTLDGEDGDVSIKEVKTPHSRRSLHLRHDVVVMLAGVRAAQAAIKAKLHDLRHTHASLALQRVVPVEVLSERLGHASVSITLDTYRHLYEVERKAAALSLNDLMMPRGALN
jgi:integrase